MTRHPILSDPDPLMAWYRAHDDAANAEGWSLFETGGGPSHDDPEIQRVDDPETGEPLEGDEDAWRLVAEGVRAGRPHAVAALALVEAWSPREFAAVRAIMFGLDVPPLWEERRPATERERHDGRCDGACGVPGGCHGADWGAIDG